MDLEFETLESALREEIENLIKYGVPDKELNRILHKVSQFEDYERRKEEQLEKALQVLEDKERNYMAVFNALGACLADKELSFLALKEC